MLLFSVIISLSICFTLGQIARPSDLSCVYAARSSNSKPHQRSRQMYYECDPSGAYNVKQCETGYVYNMDTLVLYFHYYPKGIYVLIKLINDIFV